MSKRFHNPLHVPHRLQNNSKQTSVPPANRPVATNAPNGPGPAQVQDPRRMIVEQIIRDCYSKYVVKDGCSVPELRYNTHLNIREYSQYPQRPPPTDIPPSQIGAVKNRILTVCTRSSGRVLLQKGKYNDSKHVFQIGRTWDLDELQSITRVGKDAVILLLNKDYYWKSGEDQDRFLKFFHHLASIYSKFTGRYPELNGITAEELGLPPLDSDLRSRPSVSGSAHSGAVSAASAGAAGAIAAGMAAGAVAAGSGPSRASGGGPDAVGGLSVSKQRTRTSEPASTQPQLAQHYANMDFTSNGKLPSKPMVVLDVDRPGVALGLQRNVADVSGHPQSQISLVSDTQSDTHSFVFASEPDPPKPMATISETKRGPVGSVQKNELGTGNTAVSGSSLVFSSEPGQVSAGQAGHSYSVDQSAGVLAAGQASGAITGAVAGAAAGIAVGLAVALVSGLKSGLAPRQASYTEHSFQFSPDADFGIEEAENSDEEPPRRTILPSEPDDEHSLPSVEDTRPEESAIDDSIREIENFMDTEFGPRLSEPVHLDGDDKSNFSYDDTLNRNSLELTRSVTPLTPEIRDEQVSGAKPEQQKDTEVEEMFEEVGWATTDTSDVLIKKLTKELNTIKHRNIAELRSLDFGNYTISNEVNAAADEVENLTEVFKRMEVSLKTVAPQIDAIESNSQGLQVRAVNKKILYNDLSEILNKVRVSPQVLNAIATYDSFLDVQTVRGLESNLSVLYDALGTIGKTTDEDLSSMKALRQYQDTYTTATEQFVQHFILFMRLEFKFTVSQLNLEVDTMYPKTLLANIKDYLAYKGITNFVKWLSEKDLRVVNTNVNSFLSQLMEALLGARLKKVSFDRDQGATRLSLNFESINSLHKTKSRFGSQRLMNRLSANEDRRKHRVSTTLESQTLRAKEISDPKVILRTLRESVELIYVIQYFSANFFHSTNILEYSDYIRTEPFMDRIRELDDPDLELINYKTNSNELMQSMNAVFGAYINKFLRRFTPAELITPQLLVELYNMIDDATRKNQDFINYSFLAKVVERYKSIWSKFIAGQVDMLTKSDIRTKAGVIPAVRNVNEIFLATETSLQQAATYRDVGNALTLVNQFVVDSYAQLTKAAVDLFRREDPLLKSNAHDERERAHRNVSVLQNVYSVILELGELDTVNTRPVRAQLTEVFKDIEIAYFGYLVQRGGFGKMADFNKSFTTETKRKKDDKLRIRNIAALYSPGAVESAVALLRGKMDRHSTVANSVEEHDLVKQLWGDFGDFCVKMFTQFDQIVRSGDREVPVYASPLEVRRMFEKAG